MVLSGLVMAPLPLSWHPSNSPAATQGHTDLTTDCWAMHRRGPTEIKGIINWQKQSRVLTLEES